MRKVYFKHDSNYLDARISDKCRYAMRLVLGNFKPESESGMGEENEVELELYQHQGWSCTGRGRFSTDRKSDYYLVSSFEDTIDSVRTMRHRT
jgi:hypothetical protein